MVAQAVAEVVVEVVIRQVLQVVTTDVPPTIVVASEKSVWKSPTVVEEFVSLVSIGMARKHTIHLLPQA